MGDVLHVKRDVLHVKRDLLHVKRDLIHVKRDLGDSGAGRRGRHSVVDGSAIILALVYSEAGACAAHAPLQCVYFFSHEPATYKRPTINVKETYYLPLS